MTSNPMTKKRSGGPRTDAGKAAASKNALKGGLTVNVLINPSEQAEFTALLAQLRDDYQPTSVALELLLDSLAMAVIRRRRQDRVESALYEKAQLTAAHAASQPASHSFASYLPNTLQEQARARQIVVNAAMPEMQRVDLVMRYGIALDRQFIRLLEQIQEQQENDSARAHVLAAAAAELEPRSAPDDNAEQLRRSTALPAEAPQRQGAAANGDGH